MIHAIGLREDGSRGPLCGLPYRLMGIGEGITIRDSLVTCLECRKWIKPVGVDW